MEANKQLSNSSSEDYSCIEQLLINFITFIIKESSLARINIVDRLMQEKASFIKLFLNNEKDVARTSSINQICSALNSRLSAPCLEDIKRINKVLFKLGPENIQNVYKLVKLSYNFCSNKKYNKKKDSLSFRKPYNYNNINTKDTNLSKTDDISALLPNSPLYSGNSKFI